MTPLFCTVIEPGKNWSNAAALLIHSLRRNGGRYAHCRFVVLINGTGDSGRLLLDDEEENITILTNRRHPRLPHLSKISSCEACDAFSFSHLVLLDHDTLILNLDDLNLYLADKVFARRNMKHSLRKSLGPNYMRSLVRPGMRHWSRITYFNSGVVITPRPFCRMLGLRWRAWGENLLDEYNGRPLSEQVGFAMALAETKLPVGVLPMRYNETNWKPPSTDPAIVHYNAADRLNCHVKEVVLRSYDELHQFLMRTDNRFWLAHADAVRVLAVERAAAISQRIESARRYIGNG